MEPRARVAERLASPRLRAFGSPLLGVDPYRMHKTIEALGVEYVTLSSDCGEPLFPNSVEGMRLLCGYMRAFGLSDEEVRQVSVLNPRKIVGWQE